MTRAKLHILKRSIQLSVFKVLQYLHMELSVGNYTIPDSMPLQPKGFLNRFKYSLWKLIYPIHNPVRNGLLKSRIIRHTGRQEYVLGRLASRRTVKGFLKHLEGQGFGNHFVAWSDDGQIASLRRLDGFERQYHLRIFKDGEVRGHYEFTPEGHPFLHFTERGEEERREEFLAFLGKWVVAK